MSNELVGVYGLLPSFATFKSIFLRDSVSTCGCAPVHSPHALCVVEEMHLVARSAGDHYQLLELRPRGHFNAQVHRVLQQKELHISF